MLLTPAEEALIGAIRMCADSDGVARSLFHIAVRVAQVNYTYAHVRVRRLEKLGILQIQRSNGRGSPLALKVTA